MGCCFVCRITDRRALVDVTLDDGSTIVLCGTHAVMRQRAAPSKQGREHLATVLKDRRGARDRRSRDVDELAVALRLGFAGDRRGQGTRRTTDASA
jgi:hypothetical protein